MTKYFLGAEDSVLTINENNGNVYGATGIQTLKIKSGATNIKADANIEKFSFDNPFSSYKFQQAGISLKIFDNTDHLIVDLGVRDGVGSELTFANGTVHATIFSDTIGAHVKVGGILVNDNTATTLSNPSGIDATSAVGSVFTVTSNATGIPTAEGKAIIFTVTPVAIDKTTSLSIDLQGQALNSILAITTADDFIAASPIVFNVGDTAAKQITVNVKNDGLAEGMEAYKARLLDASGNEKSSVVGTIIDGTPVINISAITNSVNEGSSLVFSVTSDVPAPIGGIVIPYRLSGNATNAVDYTITPATVTIPVGEKTGILTVNVNTDSLVEAPENITVTLDPISTATLNTNAATTTINDTSVVLEANKFFFSGSTSVNEGGKAVYTISHTPIIGTAITIPYTISGTISSNDYTTSNPSPIIFGVGDTSKTIEFPMTNDFTTEGNETFVITLGATSSVSDSVAMGQNSINTTVIDTSSTGASNTLRLTSIVETITGSDGNDVISGYIDASGTTDTLNAGDAINAGAGTDDTLLMTVDGADAGTLPAATITGVEIISIHETGGIAGNYNLSGISGLTTVINNTSSDDMTFNVASGTKMIILGNSLGTNGNTTFNNSTDLTLKDGVNGGNITRTATGVTALTINSTGLSGNIIDTLDLDSAYTLNALTINASASLTATLANDYAAGATVTVTGTASKVDLSGAALSSAISNVSATVFAGGVSVQVNQNDKTPDTAFTGGNGNDTLDIGKVNYNTTVSVNGGNGIDTLKISNQDTLSATTVRNISNFEQLEIYDDNDGVMDTFDISLLKGITTIQIDADSVGDGYSLNNLSADQAKNLVIAGNQVVVPSFNVSNALLIGNIDTIGLAIDAGITNNAVTVSGINAPGIELVEINAADSFTATTLTGLPALATMTISGHGDVNLTTDKLPLNLNSIIDATASTGMITVNASAATINGMSIKGSLTQANVLTGSEQADLLTGGAGADLLTGGSGADTINGGGNADILNGGAGSDVINGGAGADSITGGAGIDTLNGGSGDDIFSYAATADLFDTTTHTLIDSISGDTGSNSVLLGTTGTAFAIAATDIWTGRASGIDALFGVANTVANTFVLDKSAETAGVKLVDLSSNSAATGNIINVSSFTATHTTLIGSVTGATSIVGGAGNDTIIGGAGSDSITAGAGNDVIYTNGGNDAINLSITAAGSTVPTADAAEDQIYLPSPTNSVSITGLSSIDKIYLTQSAFGNISIASAYFEITAFPAVPAISTSAGIVAVGAASTGDVKLYYASNVSSLTAISVPFVTLTGVGGTDAISTANLIMI